MRAAPAEEIVAAHLGKLARVLAGRHGVDVRIGADGPKVEHGHLVIPEALVAAGASVELLTGYVDLLAARARFGDAGELERIRSPAARDIATSIDDRRTYAQLLATCPGAATFVAHARRALAQRQAERWPQLAWRERLAWRIERALWDETPTPAERGEALDAALAAADDLLVHARHARSTADSAQIATRIVARVRALAAGDAHNMMFTAGADETLDAETAAGESGDADFAADADAAPGAVSSAATRSDPSAQPDGDALPGTPPASTAAAERIRSVPLSTAFDVVTDLTGQGDAAAWRRLRGAARAETTPLKARLERALKADEHTHWRREQERGELDRPALARVATSPGYRTPFRVARAVPGRDAAVSLLIDRSGSMAGKKIELARLCAAALADALVQLGFACEVLGYSSIEDPALRAYYEARRARGESLAGYNRFVERLDLHVYKRFDSDNLAGLARIDCGHENPDGEALGWAAERLLARRAQRRILMVLSDGYPATGDGDPAILRADLRARVADLSARGVELIGVGILDDAVESFYPTSTVVERLPELPAVAFDLLGRALLNARTGGARRGPAR